MYEGLNSAEPNLLRLDDLTLEKHAAAYPEEMREPFMWLGWYLREECGRDLEVLTTRLRDNGIENDKTTWSRILRGRWKQDATGAELPSPILAVPKFLRAVKCLRDEQRIREMAGKVPFIMTPTAQSIMDFIDIRRAPERVNRFGIVEGWTGTQKTATYREYCRQHNHGLCVWLEAPENGSIKEFLMWLGSKYGGAHSDGYERLRRRVIASVKSRNTIIIDNAQTMYDERRGQNQPAFNFLRRLQDERGCTIILSITHDAGEKMRDAMLQGYLEQFEGRAGGRRNFHLVPKYPTQEDILAIAEAFGLKDAKQHLDYMEKIAREPGRVRILFEDLQTAKVQAQAEKKGLTIEHVKQARDEE